MLAAGCRQAAFPSAASGVLDLRGSDLRGAPRPLLGDWELYWNRSADGVPDAYLPAAKWRGTRVSDGRRLPAFGYATYRVKVLLPEAVKDGGSPSLRLRCPSLAPRLVELVDRCLSFDPSGRPRASELLEALDPYKRVQSGLG